MMVRAAFRTEAGQLVRVLRELAGANLDNVVAATRRNLAHNMLDDTVIDQKILAKALARAVFAWW